MSIRPTYLLAALASVTLGLLVITMFMLHSVSGRMTQLEETTLAALEVKAAESLTAVYLASPYNIAPRICGVSDPLCKMLTKPEGGLPNGGHDPLWSVLDAAFKLNSQATLPRELRLELSRSYSNLTTAMTASGVYGQVSASDKDPHAMTILLYRGVVASGLLCADQKDVVPCVTGLPLATHDALQSLLVLVREQGPAHAAYDINPHVPVIDSFLEILKV